MRVVMNAFFAAAAALGRSIQKPMSKYEASPTSSQNMKSSSKLFAITTPSIAPEKNDKYAKKRREIFVVGHVANAEDKDAEANGCDHHQHRCRQRIENKSKPQCLVAECEPGEILDCPEVVRLQRRKERDDRDCQHNDLATDREYGGAFVSRFCQTQNHERGSKWHRW